MTSRERDQHGISSSVFDLGRKAYAQLCPVQYTSLATVNDKSPQPHTACGFAGMSFDAFTATNIPPTATLSARQAFRCTARNHRALSFTSARGGVESNERASLVTGRTQQTSNADTRSRWLCPAGHPADTWGPSKGFAPLSTVPKYKAAGVATCPREALSPAQSPAPRGGTDATIRLGDFSAPSRGNNGAAVSVSVGSVSCRGYCRSALPMHARSNATSCRGLQEFAAVISASAARRCGRSKPPNSSRPSLDAVCGQPLIKSQANTNHRRDLSPPSWSRSPNAE